MSETNEVKSIPVPLLTLAYLLRHHITNHLFKQRRMTSNEVYALMAQIGDEGYEPHPVLIEAIEALLKQFEADLKPPAKPSLLRDRSHFSFDLKS